MRLLQKAIVQVPLNNADSEQQSYTVKKRINKKQSHLSETFVMKSDGELAAESNNLVLSVDR